MWLDDEVHIGKALSRNLSFRKILPLFLSLLPDAPRYVDLGELMNLGGLNGSLSALSGRIRLDGKAAGLARRAIYAVRLYVIRPDCKDFFCMEMC